MYIYIIYVYEMVIYIHVHTFVYIYIILYTCTYEFWDIPGQCVAVLDIPLASRRVLVEVLDLESI